MKTGILTFHNADSYGALLQAYALQEKLKEFGANPEFITIRQSEKQKISVQSDNPLIKRIGIARDRQKENFDSFRRKRLNLGPTCIEEESTCLNGTYDKFIAGSDQIWNFHIKDTNAGYFLPFTEPEKRYSYAASFGEKEIPEFAKNFVSEELKKFRRLSVRDPQDANIVASLTGRNAMVCVDPTLLLSQKDWEKLTVPADQGEYVLLFMLQYNKSLLDKARDIAIEKKMLLKIVTPVFMPQMGSEALNVGGVTVEKWLSLFHNAHCVLTNSYHGMLFSLIFERPLIAWRLVEPLASRNARIESLFRMCGIRNALTGQEICIPYNVFLNRTSEIYEKSVCYLESVIKDGNVGL